MKNNKKTCSTCKYHKNKPSFCTQLNFFVPRKHDCGIWEKKK